jgi:hypothetical protein
MMSSLEMIMKSHITNWTELLLIPAAVLLLAAFHRLDLLVIVVPVSILAAYALSGMLTENNSSQRKI